MALKCERTQAELAHLSEAHPNGSKIRKAQLFEGPPVCSFQEPTEASSPFAVDLKQLHAKIRELKLENVLSGRWQSGPVAREA